MILKEINLHDLSAAERQMALNEAKVLSMLDHPNIISYFDCFEQVCWRPPATRRGIYKISCYAVLFVSFCAVLEGWHAAD